MKRGMLLLGNVTALVFLADGFAMILTKNASTLGGAGLVSVSGVWFSIVLPRLVRPEARPFLRVTLPKFGALALPILFLPISALWMIATPSVLTVWFAAAWAAIWLACILASVSIPCPRCREAYGRAGIKMRPLSRTCLRCGAGPHMGVERPLAKRA